MKEKIFYEKDAEIDEIYNKEFIKFSHATIITRVYLNYLNNFISDEIDATDETLLKTVKSINECIDIQEEAYNKIKTLNIEHSPSEIFDNSIEVVKGLINSNIEIIEQLNSLYPNQIHLTYPPI